MTMITLTGITKTVMDGRSRIPTAADPDLAVDPSVAGPVSATGTADAREVLS